MSAVANIVLADAQGTPVNHTFIPLGQLGPRPGVWWFEDQSPASVIGYNRISLELVRTPPSAPGKNSGDRTNRVRLGIHTPVLETLGTSDSGLTPPPTVAFIPRVTMEFICSERASLQNRKDLRKFAQYLWAETQVVDMCESLQSIY